MNRRQGPYALEEPEASMGDLVGRLTDEFGNLVQGHLRLATLEIKEEVRQAGTGAGLLGGAGAAGFLAALLASMALAWGLAEAMDLWLALLIVAAVWAVLAAGMAAAGKSKMEEVDTELPETRRELERDRAWVKTETS